MMLWYGNLRADPTGQLLQADVKAFCLEAGKLSCYQ